MPCNIDSKHQNPFFGRPSGDWSGLKPHGVHLMMSLKPVEEVNTRGVFSGLVDTLLSRERAVDLYFPECLTQIKLNRVYRCTQNISTFHEEISKSLNKSTTNFSPKINTSSKSPRPGHEIHGETPEILFLSKCSCFFYCEIPVEHLLKQNNQLFQNKLM